MKKKSDDTLLLTREYWQFIEELKSRVVSARFSAGQAVNSEATLLYEDIGRDIAEKQKMPGLGESLIEQVSVDLQAAFPGSTGYSPRNLKSSYNLDFLGLRRALRERELKDRLISRLQSFLLELGCGFCFVGRQYRVALGRKEYFIDLLFYHRFLKSLVAFELKIGPFQPEFAGKMDFYLNLLNDKERGPDDQPSIGIILCAEKDDVEVEYALRTKANPIGVAVYQLQSRLPGEFKGKLPTAKQLAGIVRAEMEERK
jgi:hypothetical protein